MLLESQLTSSTCAKFNRDSVTRMQSKNRRRYFCSSFPDFEKKKLSNFCNFYVLCGHNLILRGLTLYIMHPYQMNIRGKYEL